MAAGLQFLAKHLAGPVWHGVVTTGEDIDGGVASLRPGVDGDMGFSQEGQARHTLGLESMGDEIEKGCTSTFRCGCDGGSQECFIVEPTLVAVVKLENAMFADHVGGLAIGVGPSRVGMQVRQGLLHQAEFRKESPRLSDVNRAVQLFFSDDLSLLTPASVEAVEVRGADQALVMAADRLQQKALTPVVEYLGEIGGLKALNAQRSGAVAMIVANYADALVRMGAFSDADALASAGNASDDDGEGVGEED